MAEGRLDNLIVLHSLSKRSAAPGLRSGFIAGDRRLIRRVTQLVNFGGSAPSFPALAASAALWREESHVEAGRERYRRCFAIAERLLGNRFSFVSPAGGFFLWLDVGDGEAAARRLWAEAGLRVLPGAYMARPDAEGRNPGAPYIRVALVHEPEVVEEGLTRLVRVLASPESASPGTIGGGLMTDQTTTGFVPAGTRVFLRRRLEEVGGILLFVLADAYLVALLTASRSDPSFNLATDGPVQHLMGAARCLFRRPHPAEPRAGELHAGGGARRSGR